MTRLIVLAICLLTASPALADVIAYEQISAHGRNDRIDFNAAACDPVAGCFDSSGQACNSAANGFGNEPCDVARIPAGRCSYGNSATCTWPLGAGRCADDPNTPLNEQVIACLPDDPGERLLTSGVYSSSLCPIGSSGCDVATNDPTCECQGTDPNATGWEGDVCTAAGTFPQATCSDGDPDRGVGGVGTGVCASFFLAEEGHSNCGASSSLAGGPVTSPRFTIENPPRIETLYRKPGTGRLPDPDVPIRRRRTTVAFEIDAPHSGSFSDFGVRQFRMLGESWFAEPRIGLGSELSDNFVTYACDIPRAWSTSLPIDGRCEDDPFTAAIDESTIACIADFACEAAQDPNSTSPPLPCDPDSFIYCHEAPFANTGLLFTRDLTAGELAAGNAAGECPPDCGSLSDFTSYETEALEAVGSDPNGMADARATLQLAFDHLEGPRAGPGDAVHVQSLTETLWIQTDPRCVIGGYADVLASSCVPTTQPPIVLGCGGDRNQPCAVTADCALKIGRCSQGAFGCNPLFDGEGECGVGNTCRLCGGTYDGSQGPYLGSPGGFVDPNNGNAAGLPVGYSDPTGELDLRTHRRVGLITELPTLVRTPVFIVYNSRAATAEFRDGTCTWRDVCTLGKTLPGAPGGPGIGAGGSFLFADRPTFDPTGPQFQFDVAWAAEDPGQEDPAFPLLRAFDVAPGTDGIPGCLGDNIPLLGTACDRILGGSLSGSTGSDDVPLLYDFSAAQDGSDMRPAVRAKFRVPDPLATRPVLNLVGAEARRDLSVLGLSSNLDLVRKSHVTWCPIVAGVADCTLGTPCAEFGGDTDGDGVCDDGDGSGTAGDGSCAGGNSAGCDDNCPTLPNPDQADDDGDGAGEECDNCPSDFNPRPFAGYLQSTLFGVQRDQFSSLTGGQRDDDNDGYGNRCDGIFVVGATASGLSTNALLLSLGSSITGSFGTCGGVVTQCSAYDVNEDSALVVSGLDLNYFLTDLLGRLYFLPGSTCPTCPLPCEGVCPDFPSP